MRNGGVGAGTALLRRPSRVVSGRTRRLALAGAVIGIVVLVAALFAISRGGATTPREALAPPHFVDESAAAGVSHTYEGPFTFATGGGLAAFDCDDDGRADLYIAGGSGPAAIYRNTSATGGPLRFVAVHDPVTDLTGVIGAYPLDVDGDGQVDLAVLRAGDSVLLRGVGGCRFERANERWSIGALDGLVSAFSAAWEGSARLPTLAFGRYLVLDRNGETTFDCGTNALVRPSADGSGYAPPVPLAPGYCTLSMLFSDWDRSGRRDLRISNDSHYYPADQGEEQLWRIGAGESPRRYTDADGWVRVQIEGMGIGSFDVTGDGYPEVFLTSQGPNRLQTLTAGPAQPTYRDIGLKRGVNVTRPFTGGDNLPSTAWHPEFQDVNNDGFIDLFISKGNVDEIPDYAQRDPSNLLLGQPDGTFAEAADRAGILSFDRGRGAALVDFNLDGLLDVVEVNYGAPTRLWRNVGTGDAEAPAAMGHWLAIRLEQNSPNRDAIGSWLEVRIGDATLRREITVGGGHAGGQIGWTHMGLGPSAQAQVRVQWPDGTVGPWLTVRADTFGVIRRGASEIAPWSPPAN